MTDEVRAYIKAKTDFIDMYYDIPEGVAAEAERYFSDLYALGEQFETVQEFETAFTNCGFYDRQYKLLERLTPKNRKLTKEEKEAAKQFKKDFYNSEEGRRFVEDTEQSNKNFIKASVFSAAEFEAHDAIREIAKEKIAKAREQGRWEAKVTDDYARRSNLTNGHDIMDEFFDKKKKVRKGIAGFFKKKLKIEDDE